MARRQSFWRSRPGAVAALAAHLLGRATTQDAAGSAKGGALFCWALITGQNETMLLNNLEKNKISIFACDDYLVLSNFALAGLERPVQVVDVPQSSEAEMGRALAHAAWTKVLEGSQFTRFRWTVRIDISAVFLPDRLRKVLDNYPEHPAGVYINNCPYGLQKSVEVFSRNSVITWGLGRHKCVDGGITHRDEHMFMDMCLWRVLKAQRVDNFRLVRAYECDPPYGWDKCQDPWSIAFHPFLNNKRYFKCHKATVEAARTAKQEVEMAQAAEAEQQLDGPEEPFQEGQLRRPRHKPQKHDNGQASGEGVTTDATLQQLRRTLEQLQGEAAKLQTENDRLHAMYSDPSVQGFLDSSGRRVPVEPDGAGQAGYFRYVLPDRAAGPGRPMPSGGAIYNSVRRFVGSGDGNFPQVAMDGLLVYGMAVIPLSCTMLCLMRVIFRLRPFLLFTHLYLALTCLCVALMALFIGADPMLAFAVHDTAAYEFAQLCFGTLFTIYICLLGAALVAAGIRSESEVVKHRALQGGLLLPVISNYFNLVWIPAMEGHLPQMGQMLVLLMGSNAALWLWSAPYLLAACLFCAVLRVEQVLWRHAHHSGSVQDEVVARTTSFRKTPSDDGRKNKSPSGAMGMQELVAMIGKSEGPDKVS